MQTQPNALERAIELSCILSHSLAPAVDPATVSKTAKIPFKVLLLRELLAYRLSELSTSACELFRNGHTIAATILTRAALEAVAWLFVLDQRIRKCLANETLGSFSNFIDRLMLGSRSPESEHQAYNVLNALDELDKQLSGFRHAYDTCSEFAHPNADGLINSYARMDHTTLLFDLHPKKHQIPIEGIVLFLAAGLELFIEVYNKMPDNLLKFAKLCETELGVR
jgi:hypothetical protein